MPTPGGVPQTSGPTGTTPPSADPAAVSAAARQLALAAVPATGLTIARPGPTNAAAAGIASARLPRRSAWPTLSLILLALLAVVGVLLLTGGGGSVARFGVRASPSAISLTAGDSAPIVLTLSAEHGFHTTVTLDTTGLPPGIEVELDRRSVPVSAGQPPVTVTGQVRTSSTVATSTVGIEVIGRAGKATDTSLIELHIQPAGITDPSSPPPVVDRASFTVSGAVHGVLRPGGSLPIDVRLMNANPFELDIDSLTVAVAGTSKPACPAADFVVLGYRGGYPLRVPAGSTSTLSSLRVPATRWPQLQLRAKAPRAGCLGATARLRYAGTGSGN